MTLVNLPLKRIKIAGHVCKCNSTTIPLLAGETFTGDWENITDYGTAFIAVKSDKESATDGLKIEQSSDAVNADHDDVYTIPAATGKNFSINPHSKYLRVKYTNSGEDQTYFRLSTILKGNSKPSSHRIQDPISSDDDATLTKSVITGEDDDGTFRNFQSTKSGNFKVAVYEYGDTSSIDAFSRLRVSNPYTIYDSKQIHDKQPIFWDELVGGSATSVHSTNNAATVMTVTASASDYAQRQTKQRFNYQAGKSLLYLATFHCPQQTGVTGRIGSFDGSGVNYMTPKNGVFFQIDDVNLSWNIAKNGTTTETAIQSNWNYDKLDGTGPSGVTLDIDSVLIALWDIEFLGVGRVRCGFVIDGVIRYCHYFNHANDPNFTSVYMSTSNLAIRYDIQSDGNGGGTLDHICSTVMSEGGQQQTGILRSIDTDTVHLDANIADTPYVAIAIRLKSNYVDITVKPEYFSVISETNDDFRWQILLNPTYNGSLSYSDVTNSAIQSALGATANDITDYGLVIDSGYSKSSAVIDRRIITALTIGSLINGTVDELILALTPLSSNADLQSSLTVRELL